jgi:uncharacterized protein YdcH (DUF465 family)
VKKYFQGGKGVFDNASLAFTSRDEKGGYMLSEHHDIDHEFPEFHNKLEALAIVDTEFAEKVARHDSLDNEIRELEERGQPIADEIIEAMKFERAELKDEIYARLRQI